MKKLFAAWTLAAVLFAPSLFASAARAVYTYDCTGTSLDPLPNPPWNAANGSDGNFSFYTNNDCRATDAGDVHAAYYDNTFGNDQYAQAVILDANGGAADFAPAVRLTEAAGAADGYVCRVDGIIERWDDADNFGGRTTLASGLATASNNDVIRCEAEGTTIRRKINGVTQGSVTDATYASGKAGVAQNGQQTWDDWEGGDLSGGGATINPAKINSPIRGGGLLGLVKEALRVR
jgi:hypothetical protein